MASHRSSNFFVFVLTIFFSDKGLMADHEALKANYDAYVISHP